MITLWVGGDKEEICCFRAAVSFLFPSRYLRALCSNSSACRSDQNSGASIFLTGQRSTPSFAGCWWMSSAYQQHPGYLHCPSLQKRKLFLLWKCVQNIPLMPSVGGLTRGDHNNCWLRSVSQENNNVSSLLSAITLTSGLRLLHCTLDVTSLAADLNQQPCRPPGGEGVEGVQKVLLNPKEQKEDSLEPSNKGRKVLLWQEARWYFVKQLFPLLCTSSAKTCLISAAAWGRSSNLTPLT